MRAWLLSGHWLLIVAGLLTLPDWPEARAQGALDHVDLLSPKMSQAELTRAEVERLIAAAPPGVGVDLADRGLNGLDLSGLDLAGADLTRARLNRARLVGARLDGARLDMSWGIEADLTGASLKGAAMFQAQFPRARLDHADLTGARIIGSFEGGSLEGARLVAVDGAPDMRNQSMGMTRLSFRSARMQGADLSGAKLAWADLEFAKLQGAKLSGTDFTRARLGGANLTGADLTGCDLTRADLASAILLGATGLKDVIGLDQAYNLDRAFRDK
jgi:uncharacterized protein YjbI with pentapeptide repeats